MREALGQGSEGQVPFLDKNNNDVIITIIEYHHVPDILGALSHLILTALLCS